MRIIFLDIDGVMNNWPFIIEAQKAGTYTSTFEPTCIKNLNKILNAIPDAKMVLSSSWRRAFDDKKIKILLTNNGIDASRMIGKTSVVRLSGGPRGEEIAAWVEKHPVDKFVVLDDNDDMSDVKDHLVLTDSVIGLTEKDADKAIKMLRTKYND